MSRARPIAAGEYVTTASKMATIVQVQPIKLELQTPESDASAIAIGMPVSAQVASYTNELFAGKVTAKNPALNPESRSLTVIAEFPNRDMKLNPGMFATAQVRLPKTVQTIYVPKTAVFSPTGSTSSQVYVVDDGKARLRVVQTGETENELVQIVSGLQPAEKVITSNPDQLFDGQPVEIQ
jgi:membrane fusion protein (multidrug efflux system)